MARRTVVALACVLALAACSSEPDVTASRSESIPTSRPADTGPEGGADEPAPSQTQPPASKPETSESAPDTADPTPASTAPGGGGAPASPEDGHQGVGDPLWPDLGNPGIDVIDYDLAVSYDLATNTIDGSVTLQMQATEDRPMFTLDIDGPEVSAVTVRGETAEFVVLPPELYITPPEPLRADEKPIEVVIEYSATPESSNSASGIPNGFFHTDSGSYVLNQPDGARSWVPSNDHPSDKASWTFDITVPPSVTAVANGRLVDHTTTPSGEHWVWREDLPMATYMIQLLTGDYELVEAEGPHGLPLVSAVLRQDLQTMQPYLDTIDDQIAFFEGYFGPYPLDRYGIAITDSFEGLAMETFGRSMFSRDDLSTGNLGELEQLFLSHELAHQWFGDAVTPSEWGDIWLNESFATYAEWMWTEHVGLGDLEGRADEALARRQSDTGDPTGSPSVEDMFAYNSYDGGAVVLHALRRTVGDPTFFKILSQWVTDYEGTSRTTADFIALAENVSGQDLGTFFDDWLYAEVPPASYPV